MKRILFIATHRKDRAPGQRFRFEQYFDYLNTKGFQCEFSFLFDASDDKAFYSHGKLLTKAVIFIRTFLKRFFETGKAKKFDIIFIFREAHIIGNTYLEKRFKRSGAKLVFDFDDAIWLQDMSDANKRFKFLKNSAKTPDIISLCDMVFAGNQYLADYAGDYCDDVRIVPTTIDTNEYAYVNKQNTGKVCIGWSGSITTIKHFGTALPFLRQIKERYGDKVSFKVIGDGNYINEELDIKGVPWTKEDELQQLSEIDIGIMPLPDDKWAKGKCALKGLQYMALGIPTIMSPVGVNSDIIQDGENGYLANEESEWTDKLSQLVDSFELRKRIGDQGRKTVVEEFSVTANQELYLKCFSDLIGH